MKIKTEYLDIAVQTAEAEMKSFGIEFGKENMDAFLKDLQAMTRKTRYVDDSAITENDNGKIKEHWIKLLGDVSQDFVNKGDNYMKKTNVADYIWAASKYLFAITFKGLNNAASLDETGLRDIVMNAANEMNEKRMGYNIDGQKIYNDQRGKDADVLRDEISELMQTVSEGKGDSMDLAELYAEFQALSKRQANHGFWWRAFHRQENIERTDLLNDMREALKGMNNGDEMKEDLTPERVARNYDRQGLGAIDKSMAQLQMQPSRAFGYENLENERRLEEEKRDKERMRQQREEMQKKLKEEKEKKEKVDKENEAAVNDNNQDRYPLVNDGENNLLMDIQDVKHNDVAQPVNEQEQVGKKNDLNIG